MKTFFKEIFEYNHHFNQKLFDIFVDHTDQASEKSIKLFNHILNAHHIWNNRIDSQRPIFAVWEIHYMPELQNIDKTNFEHTLQILDSFDLNARIGYTNSKGKVFNNSVREILFHVTNHATYHRGQIATEFRQNGLEPLVTDYIFYRR